MGEEEWTHREPGSPTGSVVPPPVVTDESAPVRPPLPRRQPKASGHQRAANADQLVTPIRRVTGSAGPELSVVGSTGPGPAARRLHLAEPPAAPTPPQLPDNVRYLFKPVLAHRPSESPAAEQTRRAKTTAAAGSHRRAAASGAGSKLRRSITWVAAVVIVVSTAVGTAFALVKQGPDSAGQQRSGHQDAGTRGGGDRTLPSLSSAAIVRGQAARWVTREISKSVIIACDDVMCTELFNQGIAASNLLVLSPTAPSPLGADVVIGTPALRSQFGQRLAREYAPTIIASFGAGKSHVDVRVVAPDGAASYELALSRDLAARQRYGGELLRDSRISLSASAQPDLIAGLVDPRLLMMLPVLANQHPIRILGFYDRAPRSAQSVPLSGAELAGYDGAAGISAGRYLRWLLVFLHSQRVPYWPTSVTTARVGDHEVVRVRFSRPSPIGFLNG